MPEIDDIDVFGKPLLSLPQDFGDGPFVTTKPARDPDRPRMAKTESLFRREDPFEENWLTDMPIFGKSDFISMGRLYISDTIGPRKFRRVAQHYNIEQSDALNGTPLIVFQGGSVAIINEGLGALAGRIGPTAEGLIGTLQDRVDTVNIIPSMMTQSARASSYQIRIRLPGMEPGMSGVVTAGSIMCMIPNNPAATHVIAANSVDAFNFGNSGSEQRVYKIDYPVGNSIPISLDIVNSAPIRIISDFTVSVLIDRRESNQQERDADRAGKEAE